MGGLGILHEHCQLDIEDNEVSVTPLAKTGYVRKNNLQLNTGYVKKKQFTVEPPQSQYHQGNIQVSCFIYGRLQLKGCVQEARK